MDDEIFLLGNRLIICGVESLLKSKGLDLLLIKSEGCNMIALQVSVYVFPGQAIIAFRGEAQRVRGGGQVHAQEGHRAGQKGPVGRRQVQVGQLKAEGSEIKEAARTEGSRQGQKEPGTH